MDLGFLLLELNKYQIYGLLFLMGSLAVATISDLKKLAAQKEFFQFWAVFAAGMFLLDLHPVLQSGEMPGGFLAKWIAIPVICVLSYSDRGIIFKLARMDVAAMAAVASMFNVYFLAIFVPLLKVISLLVKPLSKRGGRYPFVPVITVSVGIILLFNLILIG